MRLNILLCDTFPGLLPASIPSYEWMFSSLFDKVSGDISYRTYRAFEEELPDFISTSEAYLITGSNQSAYDSCAWIKDLKQWIVKAVKENVCLVGICFGHQVIAEALGGKTERSQNGWGAGIRESVIVDETMKQKFPNARMSLLYNHHDQVVKLPKNATLIATSPFCINDAYRIGNQVMCFQGHPEFTESYEMHLLTDFPEDGESAEVKQNALASMQRSEPQNALVAKVICEFFQNRVKQGESI